MDENKVTDDTKTQSAEDEAKYLQWCKDRAAEYLDSGDYINAWSSFVSDMSKNKMTADHSALELGTMLLMNGHNANALEMRKFINGFN